MSKHSAETAAPRDGYFELHDDATGERYVAGWGLIWHAPEVPREVIEREVSHAHGDDWDHLIVEVQHLHHVPRVKHCSRYDGFGCDNEGDWHGHWFDVKHNPSPLSDCCHVVAMPSWSIPTSPESPTPDAAA